MNIKLIMSQVIRSVGKCTCPTVGVIFRCSEIVCGQEASLLAHCNGIDPLRSILFQWLLQSADLHIIRHLKYDITAFIFTIEVQLFFLNWSCLS